jgi:membrane dipeptidase
MIKAIAERNGVIGASLDSWMLDASWNFDKGGKQLSGATLQSVADHVDHIAQLTGTINHSGIGSDLDGGFGEEQTVRDLNTIADLQKLHAIFRDRGYADEDIQKIFSGNWIRLLRETWS